MTVREYLDKRRMSALGAMFSGIVILLVGSIFAGHSLVTLALGFIFVFGGAMYLNYGLRCPKCNGMVSYAVCWPVDPRFIYISEKVKFCPFCGVEMDSQIKEN
jgi:hypothetical protein